MVILHSYVGVYQRVHQSLRFLRAMSLYSTQETQCASRCWFEENMYLVLIKMERRKWPSAVCFFFPIWRYSFPIQSSSLQNVSQQSHLNHRSLTIQWESQSTFGPFLWDETLFSMVLYQTISRPCCTDRFVRGSRGSDCADAV